MPRAVNIPAGEGSGRRDRRRAGAGGQPDAGSRWRNDWHPVLDKPGIPSPPKPPTRRARGERRRYGPPDQLRRTSLPALDLAGPNPPGRVLCVAFVELWTGREAGHRVAADGARPSHLAAVAEGQSDKIGICAGEAVGMIHLSLPAAEVVAQVAAEAETLPRTRAGSFLA